ncbi:MAG: endonuclease [Krumholzibacteria bacterium]|nr:endonuclease [Candidatus Krumholzibacteria bacterium]
MPVRRLLVLFAVLIATLAQAAPPAGYYDSVDLTSPATLRQTVHNVIDGHTRYPYTSSSTDTWDILEEADEDPYNSSRVLDIYRNRVYTKTGGGAGPYNREHSWPNSYGFGSSGDMPYTDCHHLFICDTDYNNNRGNLPFGECDSGCTARATDFYDGRSGTNYYNTSVWETWDGRKGDVARAMFYMDVRYAGDVSGEPDLVLTDNAALIVPTDGAVAYMGLLSVLIQWHKDDPVDDRERDRNDVVYSYQGNRNPFVDHPEWVSGIFEGVISAVPEAALASGRIDAVYPNPFNPRTTVSYTLQDAGLVSLEIYGVDGRRVRVLLNDLRGPGTFTAGWDGRDDAGRPVASGAWFVRMRAGQVVDTEKVTLTK